MKHTQVWEPLALVLEALVPGHTPSLLSPGGGWEGEGHALLTRPQAFSQPCTGPFSRTRPQLLSEASNHPLPFFPFLPSSNGPCFSQILLLLCFLSIWGKGFPFPFLISLHFLTSALSSDRPKKRPFFPHSWVFTPFKKGAGYWWSDLLKVIMLLCDQPGVLHYSCI